MINELVKRASKNIDHIALSIESRSRLFLARLKLKAPDKSDFVNLDAARQFANDPNIINLADRIATFEGSDEEHLLFTRSAVAGLSAAQHRALLMVQEKRIDDLLKKFDL